MPPKKNSKWKNWPAHFSSLAIRWSGKISRKSVNCTYPTNFLKEYGLSRKTNSSSRCYGDHVSSDKCVNTKSRQPMKYKEYLAKEIRASRENSRGRVWLFCLLNLPSDFPLFWHISSQGNNFNCLKTFRWQHSSVYKMQIILEAAAYEKKCCVSEHRLPHPCLF